jgi:hypothetical protein
MFLTQIGSTIALTLDPPVVQVLNHIIMHTLSRSESPSFSYVSTADMSLSVAGSSAATLEGHHRSELLSHRCKSRRTEDSPVARGDEVGSGSRTLWTVRKRQVD